MKKNECTNAVDYETRLAIAEAISLTHHPLLKYNDNTCARCWSAAEAVMVALDLWGAPVGEIRRLTKKLELIQEIGKEAQPRCTSPEAALPWRTVLSIVEDEKKVPCPDCGRWYEAWEVNEHIARDHYGQVDEEGGS